MYRFILVSVLLFSSISAFADDLTGKWRGDDGGTYYITQTGNRIYWYGEERRRNPAWSNIFVGTERHGEIKGRWVDVPKGNTRSRGRLVLRVKRNGNVLKATRKTGGFGGSRWTRVGYRDVPPPRPIGDRDSIKEDCVQFDPRRAQVRFIRGRWKIVDGNHWIADFNRNKGEARKALRVIKRYNINQNCFVGRPNPSFTYSLVNGRAPRGSMNREDCVSFNPNRARLKNVNGRWTIVDGNHLVFSFPNRREGRKALDIIRKYRFNKSCYVGRPDPSFSYLRR